MVLSEILTEAFKQLMLKMLFVLLPDSSAGIAHYLLIIGAVLFMTGMGHVAKRVFYSAFGLLVGWPLLGWLVMMPVHLAYYVMVVACNSTIEWIMRNHTFPFNTGSMAVETGGSMNGTFSLLSITLFVSVISNLAQVWFSIKNRYHTCTTATAISPPQKAQVAPVKTRKNKSGRKHPEDAKDSDHINGSDDDAGPSTSPDRSRKTPASATPAAQTSEGPSMQDESSDQEEDDTQPRSRKT